MDRGRPQVKRMTTGEKARLGGLRALLRVSGRIVRLSTGETIRALVQDRADITDPYETARAKTPIYADVVAVASDVASPRTVTTITDGTNNRTYRVQELLATADESQITWRVEAQRQ